MEILNNSQSRFRYPGRHLNGLPFLALPPENPVLSAVLPKPVNCRAAGLMAGMSLPRNEEMDSANLRRKRGHKTIRS